jgi:hypothetical protein
MGAIQKAGLRGKQGIDGISMDDTAPIPVYRRGRIRHVGLPSARAAKIDLPRKRTCRLALNPSGYFD